MTRRKFYLLLGLAFILGTVAIALLPDLALAILVPVSPVVIAAAVISTIYLSLVYLQQKVPRSRFFGMVLDLFVSLAIIGVWSGYVIIARATERAHDAGTLVWNLPAPPANVTPPIGLLIVLIVFANPIRFALEVWRLRRKMPTRKGDEQPLDRVDTKEGEP